MGRHSRRGMRRACARIEQLEPRWVLSSGPAGLPHSPAEISPLEAAAVVRDRYGLDGRGQTVAIIDSGIAYDHAALGGGLGPGFRVVGGWDFTDEQDADPYDDGPAGFHGTHVAGILAARDPVHPGVAPGVDIVSLRVFDDRGAGKFAWVEQALGWVHHNRDRFAHPITTVNLSVGADWNDVTTPPWAQLEDELAELERDGILVVVAAGNGFGFRESGGVGLSYPASSAHVVPVASVGGDGRLSGFSQRHPSVLAAPGERIMSTVPDHLFGSDGTPDDWAAVSGTSMAAPQVAGAGVLVRQAFQQYGLGVPDSRAIVRQLRDTADIVFDLATNESYRRLNLLRAIEQLAASVPQVRQRGAHLEISGTPGDDRIVLETGTAGRLEINGAVYPIADSVRTIVIDGFGGRDQATVVGTAAGETVEFRGHSMTLAGGRLQIETRRIDAVIVDARGGTDHARLFRGGTGRFVSRSGDAQWLEDGRTLRLLGFEQIHVYARGTGSVASLYDGPGDDVFRASAAWASLATPAQYVYVEGFAYVYAYATQGGRDRAELFDSPGDDQFEARPNLARMSGAGFLNQAYGFERVYGYATQGGRDMARLYDSAADDTLLAHPEYALFRGPSLWSYAQGFDHVYAYAIAGGTDRAMLHDSRGDDRFESRGMAARMRGRDFDNYVYDFDRVHAYFGRGGWDRAIMLGTSAHERFMDAGPFASLSGPGVYRYVEGFDELDVATGGGHDTAMIRIGRGGRFTGAGPTASVSDGYRRSSIRGAAVVTLAHESPLPPLDANAVDFVLRLEAAGRS